MPITHTNRKGITYTLCLGTTKTGKPRYSFARQPRGEPVERLPEGCEIRESANGVVSLARVQAPVLQEAEIALVQAALKAHPLRESYRLEAKGRSITLYEDDSGSPDDLISDLEAVFGLSPIQVSAFRRQLAGGRKARAHYSPVMRLTLRDDAERTFKGERMGYRGRGGWVEVAWSQPLKKLVDGMIWTLGTDDFFELHAGMF